MLSFFAYRTHTTANKDEATRSERSSWMNRPCGLKYFFSLRLVVFKTEEDEDSPESHRDVSVSLHGNLADDLLS